MHRQRAHRQVGAVQPPVQLEGEEQVRQLRPAVGAPAAVAPLPQQVLPVQPSHPVRLAGDRDHPGVTVAAPAGGHHQRPQVRGEREVAEVVGAELELEPVGGPAPGHRHHAGVVEQHVDPVGLVPEPVGERRDRRQVGQVERPHAEPLPDVGEPLHQPGPAGLPALGAAARHHDGGAVPGEHRRGLQPEPAVGAGDDDDAAVERRDVGRVPRGSAHRRLTRAAR